MNLFENVELHLFGKLKANNKIIKLDFEEWKLINLIKIKQFSLERNNHKKSKIIIQNKINKKKKKNRMIIININNYFYYQYKIYFYKQIIQFIFMLL